MEILIISRRKMAASLAIVALFALIMVSASWSYRGAVAVMARLAAADRKLPIYGVTTGEKKIAISFDAAWGAERTPQILDILDRYGLKTTFFLVTFWVQDYPDAAREIARRGHEIGLHSTTHPHMNTLSREQIRQELAANLQVVEETTGQRATLFRPPFGEYSNPVIETAGELGLRTIQWSLDSLDWRDLSAEAMAGRILEGVHPGAIVLFHNNGKHTPEALEIILPRLKELGYQVVPISQLVYPGDNYVDHRGFQHPRPAVSDKNR